MCLELVNMTLNFGSYYQSSCPLDVTAAAVVAAAAVWWVFVLLADIVFYFFQSVYSSPTGFELNWIHFLNLMTIVFCLNSMACPSCHQRCLADFFVSQKFLFC